MALTYKLDSVLKKITSPVILEIGDSTEEYPDGNAAYEQSFDKYYAISEICSKDSKVYVVLKEFDRLNDVTWCCEEQATFF
jgi:hypothetical protein